jgi:hydrogenase 3 maturation protease
MDLKATASYQQALTARLQTAREVALLAVGSEFRGDDAVALRVADLLEADPEIPERLHVFIGASAPENCTGPIRRVNPSHLLVIDAAELGAAPGSVSILDAVQLTGVSFCTHALPLNVIVDYLLSSCPDCDVIVLGVQPAQLGFGRALSPPVEGAAREIATLLRSVMLQTASSHDAR